MQEQDSWHIVYVEDDDEIRNQVKRFLSLKKGSDQKPFSIELVSSFDEARSEIDHRRYDLLILDVFDGQPTLERERAGVDIQTHLKRVRFTPTIFYTALPTAVQEQASPFVKVIGKEGRGFTELLNAINFFIDSGLLALNRGLERHVETILLDYMQNFVANHWSSFATLPDKRALAYLVTRRLAMSLSNKHIGELAQILGESSLREGKEPNIDNEENLIHRMQYYIMPPISDDFLTGDIVKIDLNGKNGYWVILTPSCDMVTGRNSVKAEYVQLAFCVPLGNFEEYTDWKAQPDNPGKVKALRNLLQNNRYKGQRERYFYLPGVFSMPHLIVDFQQIYLLSFEDIQALKQQQVASLDSPFAEVLMNRYHQYSGRLGAPALNIDDVISHLKALKNNDAEE